MSSDSRDNPPNKSLDTLVQDVYRLFSPVKGVTQRLDPEIVANFGEAVKEALVKSLTESHKDYLSPEEPKLRMSRVGKPLRQLWYEQNAHKFDTDKMGNFAKHEVRSHLSGVDPQTKLKFLYGHIIEALLIALIKLSGHTVTDEQETVSLDGVEGHIDCVVDGVLCDVKSASSYAFKKFSEGTLFDNDVFGYQGQISGYVKAKGLKEAAFIAFNKETAEITIMRVPPRDVQEVSEKIKDFKTLSSLEKPPEEKCYPEEPIGKSGNKGLSKPCSWCDFKHLCWAESNGGKGLRVFNYANGPVYLTEVVETPRVEEVTELTHTIATNG